MKAIDKLLLKRNSKQSKLKLAENLIGLNKAVNHKLTLWLKGRGISKWVLEETSKIPRKKIQVKGSTKTRTEEKAKKWLEEKGYRVWTSSAKTGYRAIGVLDYWKKYYDKLSEEQRKLIRWMKSNLKEDELKELVAGVQHKLGCPDFLVISPRSKRIQFMEVKYGQESVKITTLRWWLEHPRWKLKILVVN